MNKRDVKIGGTYLVRGTTTRYRVVCVAEKMPAGMFGVKYEDGREGFYHYTMLKSISGKVRKS